MGAARRWDGLCLGRRSSSRSMALLVLETKPLCLEAWGRGQIEGYKERTRFELSVEKSKRLYQRRVSEEIDK